MEELNYFKVPSLQKLCLEVIAKHFDSLIVKCPYCDDDKFFWRFIRPEHYIISPVADMILKELDKRKILKNEYLFLFSKRYADLVSVTLHDIYVSFSAFSIFQDFTLYSITIVDVKGLSLDDVTDSFSDGTIKNLHTLKLHRLLMRKWAQFSAMRDLGQLQNLQYLDISCMPLDSKCLSILVKNLRLKHLDISETMVDDISCLTVLKNYLNELIMHQVDMGRRPPFSQMLLTVLELKELRLLDVSNLFYKPKSRVRAVDTLIEPGQLPHLVHLEMGGNPFNCTLRDIETIIRNNKNLKYLGISEFSKSMTEEYAVARLSTKYSHVEIVGGMGEIPIIRRLQRYLKTRRVLFSGTLLQLSIAVVNGHYFPPSLFEKIMCILEMDFEECHRVHKAANLLLYEILAGDLWEDMPSELLQRILNYILTILEEELTNSESFNLGDIIFACNSADSSEDDDYDENLASHTTGDGIQDANANSGLNEEATESDTTSSGSDDIDFHYVDISLCLKILRIFFGIGRVVLDNIRICKALFKILEYADSSLTRANTLARLKETFELMSSNELEEICSEISCIQNLIKCIAEIYLTGDEMNEWLAERNTDKFSYLREFYEINTVNVDIIGLMKKLITGRYKACENFVNSGGLEICTLILEKAQSEDLLPEATVQLRELLETPRSYGSFGA
nr:hypothetical protein HmN_000076200 [Hymenolepis microstoma]